jgi:putative hydrolase of the HAD superfamily
MCSNGNYPPIEIILFDLGGVLVEWNGTEELMKLVGQDCSRNMAERFWIHSPAVRRFESGLCTAREFGQEAVAELDLDLEPEEWLRLFLSWDRGPLPGAIELLTAVGKSHVLGCLSNNNELHWGRVRDKHRFDQLFQHHYLSHEIGLCKPDPRIFQYVLNDLGRAPETVLYMDDSAEIVSTAQQLGFRAFRTRGINEVRQALVREGLFEGLQL